MRSNELAEQIAVVEYCDLRHIPIVHIPNEGKRSVVMGATMKRAGLRPGFPDLFVPLSRGRYHGLFIEMKREGGYLSDNQREWIHFLCSQGYAVAVCYGFDQTVRMINSYLRKEAEKK